MLWISVQYPNSKDIFTMLHPNLHLEIIDFEYVFTERLVDIIASVVEEKDEFYLLYPN